MLRAASLILIPLAAVALFFVWRTGEAEVHTLRTPEFSAAPLTIPIYEVSDEPSRAESGLRIGGFESPERVPGYEILEQAPVETEEARAVRLLVDTRTRSRDDYELITRDIKARYAAYDAISVEFTDTADLLDYNGGALIFNTPRGAYYMGFIYGPPNTRGYYVQAAD